MISTLSSVTQKPQIESESSDSFTHKKMSAHVQGEGTRAGAVAYLPPEAGLIFPSRCEKADQRSGGDVKQQREHSGDLTIDWLKHLAVSHRQPRPGSV